MWRIQQFGQHWVVVKPDGQAITAGGAPIEGATLVAGATDTALVALVAAAGDAGQLHDTYQEALTQLGQAARPELEAMVAAAGDPGSNGMPGWVADAAYEGTWTGDGRYIEPDALTWRNPPMPLMFQNVTEYGHFGAVLAGWISTTDREGGTIVQRGGFDSTDAGEEFVAVIQARGRFGVSIDMGMADGTVECVEEDEDGWCMRWEERITAGEVIGLTGTPFPAFAEAHIRMDDAVTGEADEETPEEEAVAAAGAPHRLLAASFPVRPPADWFVNPEFTDDHPRMEFARCPDTGELVPTGVPLSVDDDGRVYGHLFSWGTCHTGYADRCVQPPSSPSGYAYFRTGEVVCADGTRIATGAITMGIGHADLHANARAAAGHYDDSRYGVADVACGEDGYGAWYAGALRPTVTDEQVRALRALSLSGDWRTQGGALELIAALAVNHPGFPILRNLAAAASIPDNAVARLGLVRTAGRPTALVASGVIPNHGLASTSRPSGGGAWAREVERQLAVLNTRTRPLAGLAAQQLRDKVAATRR